MTPLIWMAATAALLNGATESTVAKQVDVPLTKWAATDRTQVDDDFAYQGEYLGQVRAVDGTPVVFGLQVTALGDRQFSALGYQDGLPGNGWDRETTISWEGTRSGELLVFDGPRGRIVIQGGGGLVIDSAGTAVGQVTKIRRASTTLGAAPPAGAIVLFDGTNVDGFEGAQITAEGLLDVGALTRTLVSDFRLHLEFRLPYMPYARDQGRANSGVYIQRRYEVQILDSFGLEPVFNGCAALYRQQTPDLNMSFPPLQWQTYDIFFAAARWDETGKKVADAQITVYHNGVVVHKDRDVPTKTGAGQKETPEPGPILLQDHGNPVRFRNVWLQLNPPTAAAQQELAADTVTAMQMAQASQPLPSDWQAAPAVATGSTTTEVPGEITELYGAELPVDAVTGYAVPGYAVTGYAETGHYGAEQPYYQEVPYGSAGTLGYAAQTCESCGAGRHSQTPSHYQIAPLYSGCVTCPGHEGWILWRGNYPH